MTWPIYLFGFQGSDSAWGGAFWLFPSRLTLILQTYYNYCQGGREKFFDFFLSRLVWPRTGRPCRCGPFVGQVQARRLHYAFVGQASRLSPLPGSKLPGWPCAEQIWIFAIRGGIRGINSDGSYPSRLRQPATRRSDKHPRLPHHSPQLGRIYPMNGQISCNLSQLTIAQVVEHILASGRITRTDQNSLRCAISSEESPPSPEEIRQIKGVFNRLQMGLLKVMD